MLKKIHVQNHSNTSCIEKKYTQCTVCKTLKNPVLYVCTSGHVICKSCQKAGIRPKQTNEGGDNVPEKEFVPSGEKKEIETSDIESQNYASGDRDGTLSEAEIKSKMNDFKNRPKSYTETTIKYKNDNYQESHSSVNFDDSTTTTENIRDVIKSCKIVPRPVVCPVTNCSKMVTIDSIMLHFHFDHSKVPKKILDDTLPQEVYLKSANFSTEIQCITTFTIETNESSSKIVKKNTESVLSVRNATKDNKLLLLMAVRLPTSPVKYPNLKCDTSRIFTRSIHTQTEKYCGNELETSTDSISRSSNVYKSCLSQSDYDEDEVILLWLCKFDNEERVYSITLLGEDKKRGYCYIGDAVHVRDKQDPSLLYNKSECLIVKGSAVSSLYDLDNQITAIVSIIG